MTNPHEHGEPGGTPPRGGRIPADTLSNRLILARALAGHLSIREAADLCGLGRGAWTKWERGTRPIDVLEITGVIADKLDIDLDWLRFGGPLAGPKGRPVRSLAKQVGEDTDRYAPVPVRPMPARPRDGRPKTRSDARAPGVVRPTVVTGPLSAERDLAIATA